jgi:hypothetical protein
MSYEYKILVGKPEGKRPLRNLGITGKIILKWILGKLGLRMWIVFIWFRTGTGCMFL